MKKIRRNFAPGLAMHLCCADDELRPAMNYIYFENGIAYATESYVLVANDLRECSDFDDEEIAKMEGKFLHKSLYRTLIKYDWVQVEDDGFLVKGPSNTMIKYMFSKDDMKYPNAKFILNNAWGSLVDPLSMVGIKPALLDKIGKALWRESEAIALLFGGVGRSILVKDTSINKYKSVGLIMPYLINE